MAYDAGDLGVDQFLCNRGADFGIALIVFGDKFEFDFFAVDGDAFGVGLVEREPCAILVVFAQMRGLDGERSDVTDLDDSVLRLRRGFGFGRRLRRLFLAAALHQQCGGEQQPGG